MAEKPFFVIPLDLGTITTGNDGTPRMLMASDRIRALGWSPRIGLRDALPLPISGFSPASCDTGH